MLTAELPQTRFADPPVDGLRLLDRPRPGVDPFDGFGPALQRAHALAAAYIESLPTRPVSRQATPAAMAAALAEPLPESGVAPDAAVAEWLGRAEPGIVASSGPRFFGWVIGGTTPAALAGDWLAAALNQCAAGWAVSPAAIQTELTVLGWLKELFGLPADRVGALTSGTSMSHLVGLAAARQWASGRLGFDAARDGLAGHPPIPVLASTEIHVSAVKALAILGIGRSSLQKLPAPGGSVDLDALAAALAAIDGPAIVVANAGEVNTGAFDDIAAMADLCARHPGGAWLHVDGAFGLFAAASPQTARLVRGVERADSVAADAHKWLNVPYDSGFVLVRDAEALRAAFAVAAAYIAPQDGTVWDPFRQSHTPELARRFRGLPVWCALKALGRTGVQALVERCLGNAAAFAGWVEAEPGLELVAPAPLNIVCFRYAPAGLDPEATDAFNRAAVTALQADGRVVVSGTNWRGREAVRAAFDNWATGPADVAILERAVADVGRRLVADGRAGGSGLAAR
ncbi:MAG: Aromatic-L-amino-acid decarboxylase [uncultured Thermomicrobiales bacterium]|uniref:Aromatic-L-amino-acid decarboxylase n=1 Tax=uncultured Thermomicrobiales bacterium TaxID=1645740 RepID=A0A6J4V8G2_9BACT|nr:MAG: Aromatic-L-amino-acid decarboxylase [uncultured Thermomicrobiales bacterium]